jgi:putative sterol carrier protein
MPITVAEIFQRLPDAFQPEAAGDTEAVIAFRLSGAEAGDWTVTIAHGTATVEQGGHADPTLTFSADSEDFVALITGELEPMSAFMRGKLQLDGSIGLALKFAEMFKVD